MLPLFILLSQATAGEEIIGPKWDHLSYPLSSAGESGMFEFVVLPGQSVVAERGMVRLQFGMMLADFAELDNGGFSFTFPDGFDLAEATAQEISDDLLGLGYFINKSTVSGQTITVRLSGTTALGGMVTPPPDSVRVTLVLADVVNPTLAAVYRLAGLAFGSDGGLVSGPTLSAPFEIVHGPAANLTVTPAEPLELAAGEFVTFSATVADAYGNPIAGAQPSWLFSEDSDAIGTLDGSLLRATTPGVGRVRAVLGDLSAFSGYITVTSGRLARVELELASQQVIGQPLLVEPQVVLRDQFDNLLMGYDLAFNPLILQSSAGALTPVVIDDPTLFDGGVIDLREAGAAYSGPGGEVVITASTGGVSSRPVQVSFNGYEILALLDEWGEALNSVTAEAIGTARVVIRHDGSLGPVAVPTLSLRYAIDGASGSAVLPLLSNGETDTVSVSLPRHRNGAGSDTLQVELRSRFSIQGTTYTALAELSRAIEVRQAAHLEVVEGTLGSRTVYPGQSYRFGFDVEHSGLPGGPDSARIMIWIPRDGSLMTIQKLFDGWAVPTVVTPNRIVHTDLVGGVHSNAAAGTYEVWVSYELAVGGSLIEAETAVVGTINVLDTLDIEYVSRSLRPTLVSAGVGATFAFEVELGNDYTLMPDISGSEFELRHGDFRVTANVIFPGGQLNPGVTTLRTGQLVIPEELIGMELEPRVRLALELTEAEAMLHFSSSFNSESVQVEELPVARVESVQPVTVNGTFVNTGQTFYILCRVANLSSAALGSLELTMVSDGDSRFEPVQTIDMIAPGAAAEVLFEVTASEADALSEVFRVDITSTGISVLPPVDDVALVTIQRPAVLGVSYELPGLKDSLVERSGSFSLTVRMENTGQAAVSAATWELNTGGVDFGFGGSQFGMIRPGETAVINFQAPAFDTATTLRFRLTEHPLEYNTERVVPVDGVPFEIPIRVISAEGDLLVDPYLTGPNVVLPGRLEELFRVDMVNRGSSIFADIELRTFTMRLFTTDRQPLNVSEILNETQMGFYLQGEPVTSVIVDGNRMHFEFSGVALSARQEVTMTFGSVIREGAKGSFLLVADINEVKAEFLEGPNAGKSPEIVTTEDNLFLIEQVYVIKGSSLDESFVLEANPVNPAGAPARFTYELEEPGTIEFRVFTLTGEEVFAKTYPEGTPGTETGEHELFWDGRNNDGRMVLNGVYIAIITNTRTGDQARIKIAIVK